MNIAQIADACYSCGKPTQIIKRGAETWVVCKCGHVSPLDINSAAIRANGLPCRMCKGRGFRMVQDEVEGHDGRWVDVEVRRSCQFCSGEGRVAA